jgi:hypothetical protein
MRGVCAVNALSLYHDLTKRGIRLEADGDGLRVDAPAGVVTDDLKAALSEAKPVLLRLLSRLAAKEESRRDDGRRFYARCSKHTGYTALYDPVEGEWHDFPTKDCFPSIVALADKRREKGGAA